MKSLKNPNNPPGLNFLTEGSKEYLLLTNKGLFSIIAVAVILTALLFVSTLKPWKSRTKDLVSNLKQTRIIILAIILLSGIWGIYSMINLSVLRKMPIEKVDLLEYADGVYEGVFYCGGGPYTVQVTTNSHQITDIQLTTVRQAKYIRYARSVIPRIIEAQSPAVDGITGATTTSRCIMKAVENALNRNL